ncbi:MULTISPECIES: hypothetical protein [Kocuria]|uniref:Uncharacterized protein n=1 Tax=Kocuria subflava TaxID=1736139 RepID=A0A846TW05_9MICC|nr:MULTISPECIES: hypothetical protein [Kocuria]NKE08495.1 hypothetical protein [Kocuria subflava]
MALDIGAVRAELSCASLLYSRRIKNDSGGSRWSFRVVGFNGADWLYYDTWYSRRGPGVLRVTQVTHQADFPQVPNFCEPVLTGWEGQVRDVQQPPKLITEVAGDSMHCTGPKVLHFGAGSYLAWSWGSTEFRPLDFTCALDTLDFVGRFQPQENIGSLTERFNISAAKEARQLGMIEGECLSPLGEYCSVLFGSSPDFVLYGLRRRTDLRCQVWFQDDRAVLRTNWWGPVVLDAKRVGVINVARQDLAGVLAWMTGLHDGASTLSLAARNFDEARYEFENNPASGGALNLTCEPQDEPDFVCEPASWILHRPHDNHARGWIQSAHSGVIRAEQELPGVHEYAPVSADQLYQEFVHAFRKEDVAAKQ